MKEKNRESCKQLVKIRNCGIVRRNKTYYKIPGYRTGIRTLGAPLLGGGRLDTRESRKY